HAYGEYFGRFEKFGVAALGTLHVDDATVRFESDEATTFRINLLDLTAIQLSSSSLQIKVRDKPVMTIRFAHSSPKLWDERLQIAVREAWTRAGRGEVVEFQPRIVAR